MDKPDRNEKEQSELIRMKKKLNDVRRARLAFVHSQVDSFVPPPGSCATMSVSQMYEIQRLGKLVEDWKGIAFSRKYTDFVPFTLFGTKRPQSRLRS